MLPANPQFYELTGVEGIRGGFVSWLHSTAAKMGLNISSASGSAVSTATAFVNALQAINATEKAQQEAIISAEIERLQAEYEATRVQREQDAITAAATSNEAYRAYMTELRDQAFNPQGVADIYTFYTPAMQIPLTMAGVKNESPMQQILSGLAAENVNVTQLTEQSPVDYLKQEMAKDRCIPTSILTAALIALILSR